MSLYHIPVNTYLIVDQDNIVLRLHYSKYQADLECDSLNRLVDKYRVILFDKDDVITLPS